MKIENPAAYKYFLQDEIFLLENEKPGFAIAEPELPKIESPEIKFKFLGENKKNFLVLVHYHENEFMVEKHLTALESTIKRLGYEIDDMAIFNLSHYPEVGYQQIIKFFAPKKILVLGKMAAIETLAKIEPNKIHQIKGLSILHTFSFDEMMDSNENKKIFWEQMKQI